MFTLSGENVGANQHRGSNGNCASQDTLKRCRITWIFSRFRLNYSSLPGGNALVERLYQLEGQPSSSIAGGFWRTLLICLDNDIWVSQ